MSSNARPVPFAYAIMATFMIVTAAFLVVASASKRDTSASATIDRGDVSRIAFTLIHKH